MADPVAADRTTATLLLRISEAIASRSIPPLVNSFADHYDWRLTLMQSGRYGTRDQHRPFLLIRHGLPQSG